MSARARSALAALLVLAGCGSSEGPTGIVVEVTSDLAPSAELQFHLEVFGAGGLLREIPFGSSELPARLNLVPSSPDQAGQVTVVATASVGTPPLSQQATLSFKRGALVLLHLALNADCACVTCKQAGSTCAGASCVSSLKDPATLPAWTPGGQATPGARAVPVCMGDAGPPGADAGADAGQLGPDARSDTASIEVPPAGDASANQGSPPLSDATAAPDVTVLFDASVPPDVAADVSVDLPVVAPDTGPGLPADAPAPMPDSAPLPPDAGGRPLGAACTSGDQCASTACVDGSCCNSSCTGLCMACSSARTGVSSGQCAPALAGTNPDGDCAADAPSSCLYDGLCNGVGACRLYGTSTLCAAATCGGSTFTPARMCTGVGGCMPPSPVNCDQFLCTPSGCPATCQSHASCISTAYCDGTCKAKKAALAPCSASYECQSGTCLLQGACL